MKILDQMVSIFKNYDNTVDTDVTDTDKDNVQITGSADKVDCDLDKNINGTDTSSQHTTTEQEPKEDDDKSTVSTNDNNVATDNTIDLNNPDIRLTTSIDISNDEYIVGCSIQGRSHIGVGAPCQDYHAYTQIAPNWHLSIVSDGAGSAKESERGSKANCNFTTKLITKLIEEKKWAENNYLPSDKEWYIEMRNVLEVLQEIIKMNTKKLNDDALSGDPNYTLLEPRDFNATLLLILTTPKGMLTAHIGDGRMGYLSTKDEWISLMTPHKGVEANETVFVPNNWNNQIEVPAFAMSGVYLPETMVIPELPKAIVIMSDGCEKFTWLCTAYDSENKTYYDRNKPFAGFLNPLIDEMSAIKDQESRANRLIDIINVGTAEAKREQDDRTLLMGVFNR